MAAHFLAIVVPWAGPSEITPALAALVGLNMSLLRRHKLPSIYESGVRYQREERGADGRPREQWLTAPVAYMRQAADCEDLSGWLCAQRRLEGIECMAVCRESSVGWHIVVRYPDGSIEDPSRKLGM